MEVKKVCLCKSGCCPSVEIGEKTVKIGEAENTCTLKRSEWDNLVRMVKSGEI